MVAVMTQFLVEALYSRRYALRYTTFELLSVMLFAFSVFSIGRAVGYIESVNGSNPAWAS